MAYNGKSEYSKIESIIKTACLKYGIPNETPFSSVKQEEQKHIVQEIAAECKRYVIGALYNDFEGKLYSFSLRGDGLFLSNGAYEFISKYKMEIEKLNYFSWAKYLERINDDSVSIKLLEKLEISTPRRSDLSVYRELLYKEFQENRCFYCGKELKREVHVDHFIPWCFVKTDNLWNFVLACPKCNIQKKDHLMGCSYIHKINKRNSFLADKSTEFKTVENEFKGYYDGLIDQMWNYARMSGLKEIR